MLTGPVGAGENLAALVPDGAVFVMRGLEIGRIPGDFEGTPLARAFCDSPLARFLRDSGKMDEFNRNVAGAETKLGFKLWPTFTRLAGEEIILAVYPGAAPHEPKTVLLLRGPDGVDAAAVAATVLSGLAEAGEIELLPAVKVGGEEFSRFRNKEGEEILTVSRGPVTLLANTADMAGRVLDLAAGTATDSILDNPRLRDTARDLVEDAHVSMFLDVGAIVAVAEQHAGDMPPPAQHALRLLGAVKGVAGAVHLHRAGITSRYRVAVDESRLPPFFKAWLAEPDAPGWFSPFVRRDAVFAGMAARIDMAGLVAAMMEEMPPPMRERMERQVNGVGALFLGGKSFFKDFLPAMGPDMALLFTDLDPSDNVPGEITVLVRINDEAGSAILANLLRSLYGLTQLAGDNGQAAKHTFTDEGGVVELTRMERDVSPTVIVTPGAVIAGSSQAAARKIQGWLATPPDPASAPEIPPFKGMIAGVDLQAFGRWLLTHADLLAEERARKEGVPVEEARRWLTLVGKTLTGMNGYLARGTTVDGAFEIVGELTVKE
jgi:hypothetical protein